MPSDLALVDTNVLVYATYEDMEHHPACVRLLEEAQNGQMLLCTSPQVLAELYATITNSRRVANPFPPLEAVDVISQFLAMAGMVLLSTPDDLAARWLELVRRVPVAGGRIFDHQLVATMLANGVTRLYTYNRRDFEPFGEIEVLTP